VFFPQNAGVPPPRRFGQLHRAIEKVAAGQDKGSAFFAGDAPADRIFPISRVQGQFPDVVTRRRWTPGRLFRRDAANRPSQVRTVPGFPVEGFVEQIEEQSDF